MRWRWNEVVEGLHPASVPTPPLRLVRQIGAQRKLIEIISAGGIGSHRYGDAGVVCGAFRNILRKKPLVGCIVPLCRSLPIVERCTGTTQRGEKKITRDRS